jgi:predicted ester cyclase
MHLTNEIVIAEGDKVAMCWQGKSVHQGEFMGVAPTSKQVMMTGNSIARIEGGKIVEEWTEMDTFGLMQ